MTEYYCFSDILSDQSLTPLLFLLSLNLRSHLRKMSCPSHQNQKKQLLYCYQDRAMLPKLLPDFFLPALFYSKLLQLFRLLLKEFFLKKFFQLILCPQVLLLPEIYPKKFRLLNLILLLFLSLRKALFDCLTKEYLRYSQNTYHPSEFLKSLLPKD